MGKDVGSGHILIDLARRETFVSNKSNRCVELDDDTDGKSADGGMGGSGAMDNSSANGGMGGSGTMENGDKETFELFKRSLQLKGKSNSQQRSADEDNGIFYRHQ